MTIRSKKTEPTKRSQADLNRSFIELLESRQLLSAGATATAPLVAMPQATAASSAAPRVFAARLAEALESNATGTIVTVDAFSDPNIAASLSGSDAHFVFDSTIAFRQFGPFGGAPAVADEAEFDGPPHPIEPAVAVSNETTNTGAIAVLAAFANASTLTSTSTTIAADSQTTTAVANDAEILDGDRLSAPTELQNIQPVPVDESVGQTAITGITPDDAPGASSTWTDSASPAVEETSYGADAGKIGAVFIPRAVAVAVAALVPTPQSLSLDVTTADASRTQQIARMLTVPAEVVVSSAATFVPEMGRMFSDAVVNVEDDLSAISSALSDFGGSDSITAAALVADVALLAYYYNNRNRERVAAIESLFNDTNPIEMAR